MPWYLALYLWFFTMLDKVFGTRRNLMVFLVLILFLTIGILTGVLLHKHLALAKPN